MIFFYSTRVLATLMIMAMLLCVWRGLTQLAFQPSGDAALSGLPVGIMAISAEQVETRSRHGRQQAAGLPFGPEIVAPAPTSHTNTKVSCATTAGPLSIDVHHDWAPRGAVAAAAARPRQRATAAVRRCRQVSLLFAAATRPLAASSHE